MTCKASVTPEMAVKLSKVLGSSPRLWLKLQESYSLDKAEKTVNVSKLTPLFTPINY
ncbi:putative DNA-binding transcriptional regulator (fragment) [Xenorhabdus bovienii str. puntauvense]|uniref:Putative DNA-binding transcriptional regulator n=2 Tax=Xenorhabdus bovienii TaxID=40576 RepID=A0A077NBA8_XENBV